MNEIPAALQRKLEVYGARVSETRKIDHATQYRLVKDSETATLNVYSTDKVSEGGKESGLKEILRDWRLSRGSGKKTKPVGRSSERTSAEAPISSFATKPNATPRVGTDEAGKGEYFGPLVVAGTRVLSGEIDVKLREVGVRDSKELGSGAVRRLASEVGEILGPKNLRVVCLAPREYEARRDAAGENVNRLLAEINAAIISELEDEVEVAVVDAFGVKARDYILEAGVPGGIEIEARPGAEDDAAVAAASILARSRYLEEMERLSEDSGFALPRGSTHVLNAAKRVFGERGEEGLEDVAKVHFSITQRVVELEGESQKRKGRP